ncbi:hypothetical protein HK104_009526 [Borealophlyctis nickersoniae]|nr:hypothetical protein HK104_009526 [Borealophlyctis nickersoniae]
MSNEKPNYYKLLNVDPSASKEVIKLADKHALKSEAEKLEATRRSQLIQEASTVLLDDQKRAQYDALLMDTSADAAQHWAAFLDAIRKFLDDPDGGESRVVMARGVRLMTGSGSSFWERAIGAIVVGGEIYRAVDRASKRAEVEQEAARQRH